MSVLMVMTQAASRATGGSENRIWLLHSAAAGIWAERTGRNPGLTDDHPRTLPRTR
jgi:hypothetical protein